MPEPHPRRKPAFGPQPSDSGLARRDFLSRSVAGIAAAGGLAAAAARAAAEPSEGAAAVGPSPARPVVRIDEHRVAVQATGMTGEARILFLADTHLARDDQRGEPYRQYSARMAGAYRQTSHWQSRQATDPEACFRETLAAARAWPADLVVLAGDIVSFPSLAAVEWATERLLESGLPFLYVAGNHDWHYEGLEGSSSSLRAEWSRRHLAPLYQGADPLMAFRDVQGLRVLAIDNSTYEATAEQLAFLQLHIAAGKPLLLACHIPLYVPGRPVGFGCGHPEWNAEADRHHRLERRPPWPTGGHTEVTRQFHREVFAAPRMALVCAGHIHQASVDVFRGLTQVVAPPNLAGGYLQVSVCG